MAVVAVAGTNVYLANDIRVQRNELSLLNLENIADADELWDHEGSSDDYNIYWDNLGNGEVLWNVDGPGFVIAGFCNMEYPNETCRVPIKSADFMVGDGRAQRL